MPNEPRLNFIDQPHAPETETAGNAEFAGFRPPVSNTTYTPNQFFDVVLPNASRGCLRIVGYLIRRTLGWCDAQGNPQHERIEVSYSELIRKAGLSRNVIRGAVEEALDKNFIERIRGGRKAARGDSGETALYALKWDASPVYVRSLPEFRGFFEGEGHRTDIPNEFFDRILPQENHAVIKVVGSVIRYSIGFQARHGSRRQQAALAYSQIMRASGLASRSTLAGAVREALRKKFIVRPDPGYFSPRVADRRSAVYALRWSDGYHAQVPLVPEGSPETAPAGLWIKQSGNRTSSHRGQSGNRTSSSPETAPAGQSGNRTIEIKLLNKKQKQQPVAAGEELLRKEGFDAGTAAQLAERHPAEVIRRQVEWIGRRHAARNRTGLLRRAIENDWPEPAPETGKNPSRETDPSSSPQETARRQELVSAYCDWLLVEEENYRNHWPEEYSRFTTKRDRRRQDLLTERSAPRRALLLEEHDSETGRLSDFRHFFSLPDLPRWKAAIYHKPSLSTT